jgi:hypothetical protein
MPVIQFVNNLLIFVNGTTISKINRLLNRIILNINTVNF